jgi:hypothetical protein
MTILEAKHRQEEVEAWIASRIKTAQYEPPFVVLYDKEGKEVMRVIPDAPPNAGDFITILGVTVSLS